jgi:hypothetical protein
MSTKNRKSSTPAKTTAPVLKTSTSTGPTDKPDPANVAAASAVDTPLVRIHDVTGQAVLYFPKAMRDILGKEGYESARAAVEASLMTIILRGPNDVICVELPLYVIDADKISVPTPAVATSSKACTKKART